MKKKLKKQEKVNQAIEDLMTQLCPKLIPMGGKVHHGVISKVKIQKPSWTQEDVDFVREMIITRMMTWGYAREDIYPTVEYMEEMPARTEEVTT